MIQRHLKTILGAALLLAVLSDVAHSALTFSVDAGSPWPAGWYNAAVANMQTTVNLYNAYGDFGNGNINVYYNAGIPTAQSGYGGWGSSIGVGGTYPNVRVLLHESSHWLGTGTYSAWWNGPAATAILQQFEGLGSGLGGDAAHYWPYGENYDNESSPVNDVRHVALVYALRKDFGIGSTARPSSATNVTLTASDAAGTSGFNYPFGWSDAHFPQAGTNYSTGAFSLRTPQGYPSWTFAGDSLTVNTGGKLLFNGWGTSGAVTVKNLILDGGTVKHDQFPQDLMQLAGKVTLATTGTFDAADGNLNVAAGIGGAGSLTKTGNYAMTLSGTNTYAGSTTINTGTLRLAPAAPIVNYSFANVSGATVVNDGTGGAGMNGTLNANGGNGSINTTVGPAAGLGSLVLNGNGTTVDINSGVTDLGGQGTWTVSAWIKTTQAGATILNKGDGANWNSGYSTFYLGDGSDGGTGGRPDAVQWGGGWVAGSSNVNNGVWHQVTYTNLGGTKTIYVDGVAQALSQNQFFNADTGSKIRIGFAANPGDGAQATNGSLSGIKIFNSALSASQVAQLYSGGPTTNVLPTTTNVSIAAGAALDVNGVQQTIGSLAGVAGSGVTLGSGGQLVVSSAANTTFAGNISGRGGASLTKSNSGTLTLSGVNTYTGPTTISGGTLRLANPAAVAAATPIASYTFNHLAGNTVINDGSGGAAMNGTLNANGGTGSINPSAGPAPGMGALMLNGNGTTVDINSGITNLGGSNTWTVSAWIKTTQAGATIFNKGNGTTWDSGYSTFYLGDGNDVGSGGVPSAVRWGGGWVSGATPVNDGNWHLLTYSSTAGVKTMYVDGVAEGLSQSDFLNADSGTKVRIGFAADPGDGAQPTNGSLSGISFYSTALTSAQISLLFGSVIGAGSSATALPTATHVTIAAGATLDVNGLAQTIGSLTGPTGAAVTLGTGRLTVNSAANAQFGGVISGVGGSLVKQGAGTLTLDGTNTYTGATTVSAGVLNVNGSITSATTVNGGLLGGTGTIAGNVVVNAAAAVGAGTSVESLNITGTFSQSGKMIVELAGGGASGAGAGTQYDVIAVTGNGTLTSGSTIDVDLVGFNPSSGKYFDVLTASDINGAGNSLAGVTFDYSSAALAAGLTWQESIVAAGANEALRLSVRFLGDADGNNEVNFDDLGILLNSYNQPGTFDSGDFNKSGTVDFNDLGLLLNNYNQQAPLVAASSPVPEPGTLVLAACGFVGLFGFCWRLKTTPGKHR